MYRSFVKEFEEVSRKELRNRLLSVDWRFRIKNRGFSTTISEEIRMLEHA